jgi:hypothetical protein
MSFMFRGASAFNQTIGKWDTAAVVSTSYMFLYATDFNANCDAVAALCPWDKTKAQLSIGGSCGEPCEP